MEIPKLNVTPLVNERVCIPGPKKNLDCKGGLYLAGLEDLATRNLRYCHLLKSLLVHAWSP